MMTIQGQKVACPGLPGLSIFILSKICYERKYYLGGALRGTFL